MPCTVGGSGTWTRGVKDVWSVSVKVSAAYQGSNKWEDRTEKAAITRTQDVRMEAISCTCPANVVPDSFCNWDGTLGKQLEVSWLVG